jgi:hypothetical protein
MKIPLILDLDTLRAINQNDGLAELSRVGFIWDVKHYRQGRLLDHEVVHNLMPTEGLNYLLDTSVRGVAQLTSWYIGLFEGNYTPVLADTAATFPASATESTAYAEAARQAFTVVAAAGGVLTNTAAPATFTANASKTWYGGFISSASAKSATTGKLLSAAQFSTAKAVANTDQLIITASITLTSS